MNLQHARRIYQGDDYGKSGFRKSQFRNTKQILEDHNTFLKARILKHFGGRRSRGPSSCKRFFTFFIFFHLLLFPYILQKVIFLIVLIVHITFFCTSSHSSYSYCSIFLSIFLWYHLRTLGMLALRHMRTLPKETISEIGICVLRVC